VFKISANGFLSSLYLFGSVQDTNGDLLDGSVPSGLVQGSDGYFYGTTSQGGINNFGTVFKISTSGVLTRLYSFGSVQNTNGYYPLDGANPQVALVQGTDGYFYGTTPYGGTNGDGTVFKINSTGVLTSLYSFTGGGDGFDPNAALVQGNDGYFYGTTAFHSGYYWPFPFSGAIVSAKTRVPGGPGWPSWYSIPGTVFRISTNGALTTLQSFSFTANGLMQDSDGNLYGTTSNGGTNGVGLVFVINTNGTMTTLYSFTGGSDGANPEAALVQGSDGNFYGTASSGGQAGAGTIFRLTILLDLFSQSQSQAIAFGSNATLSVEASGTGRLDYQWYFDGTPLQGQTNTTLLISGAASTNAGTYYVVVTNLYGSATSAVAGVTVGVPPGITAQPVSQTNSSNGTITFSVAVSGTGPLAYQWQFNGMDISTGVGPTLVLSNLDGTYAGTYDVVVSSPYGSVTSSIVNLVVLLPPAVSIQPLSQGIVFGSNAILNIEAAGTDPLAYQWYFDSAPLPEQTSATLLISVATFTNAGAYYVVVTNLYGLATSAVVIVTVGVPPSITAQPTSQTNLFGSTASFSVFVSGTGPVACQWQFTGTNLATGGGPTLELTNVSSADVGLYDVVVSSPYGSVTSSIVSLMVLQPPVISTQPRSQAVLAGSYAFLNIGVSGAAPLYYQWYFDRTPLPGQTNTTLLFSRAALTNAGDYYVVVTNLDGSTTSAVAVVTVPQRTDYSGIIISTTNLLGYWRFDPVFQVNSWVNGYTGALQGNAQIGPPNSGCPLASDPANQGLLLDGSNSYLTTSLTGRIDSQGTVLVWVYLSAQPSTVGHIFEITSQVQSGTGNDFDFQIQTDNHIYFFTDLGSITVYPQALSLNQWHFLAATFVANSTRSIYLDGQLVASSTAGPHSVNNNPFCIGNDQVFGPHCFQGRIDEVAIFDRALSSSEIAVIYAAAQRPTLNVTPLNNAVLLTWSTNFTGYVLQTTASLSTTNWTTLAAPYGIIATNYAVPNSINGSAAFFRLQQ
jgi:uncharacterized repeat protein (TIGR03803 family)